MKDSVYSLIEMKIVCYLRHDTNIIGCAKVSISSRNGERSAGRIPINYCYSTHHYHLWDDIYLPNQNKTFFNHHESLNGDHQSA